MREILFMIEQTQNGYEGRSVQEYIYISGESWHLLKDNAELAVRSHFAGRGVPCVLRFRQEETIHVERALSEHPWYELLSKALYSTPKCEEQIRLVIDFFESWGYIDDLYPYWVTDPLECTLSKTPPGEYDNGDGFDCNSYIDRNSPQLVYMDRMCHQP